MKIPLNQFKEGRSLVLKEKIAPADFDLDIGIMKFPEPIDLSIEAWKTDDTDLTVEAHVEGKHAFTCSRCLEEVNNPFEKEFTLHYDIKGLESVTIDQDVRDELILEHPIRVLCRQDCRGLCAGCGANLNFQQCRCAKGPEGNTKKGNNA